jgi:hypothetical protein
MRARLVFVTGPLNEREPTAVEDFLEAGEARMQPERNPRRVGADLQHVGRRHGD